MPIDIKSEAQPRLTRIQRPHWDSNIGLNDYVNRTTSSSPSALPTSSTSRPSTPTDSATQDSAQADDLLLHPPPRTVSIPPHSRKSLRAALRADPTAKDWRRDNTIRLLPAIAHIKIDTAAGITIDPQYPQPPTIPERSRLSPEPRLLEVGFINNPLPRTGLVDDASNAYRAPTPQRVPVFIGLHRIPCHIHNHQYSAVDPSGNTVHESFITWNPGLQTPEQRREVVDQLLFEKLLDKANLDRDFEEKARVYRRQRLEWEVQLVRNEWVRRKNWGLFRPGTTGWGVGYAVRVGRKELEEELQGVRKENENENGDKNGDGGGREIGAVSPQVEKEMRGWDDPGLF